LTSQVRLRSTESLSLYTEAPKDVDDLIERLKSIDKVALTGFISKDSGSAYASIVEKLYALVSY
jgi:hypothetical protein